MTRARDLSANATGSAPTIIDAKGDLIAGTGADAASRLAVGTNGQVLTADSTNALGVSWQPAASGGMTLLSTTTLSGASTTISSISQSYYSLLVVVYGVTNGSSAQIRIAPNGSTAVSDGVYIRSITGGAVVTGYYSTTYMYLTSPGANQDASNAANSFTLSFPMYSQSTASGLQPYSVLAGFYTAGAYSNNSITGTTQSTGPISSLVFTPTAGSFTAGTVKVYGVK